MAYVTIDKRSKREQKEYHKKQRTSIGFNTGTRIMKDAKHPSRQDRKKEFKKMLDE